MKILDIGICLVLAVAGACSAGEPTQAPRQRLMLRRATVTNAQGTVEHALVIDGQTNTATTVEEFTKLLSRVPRDARLFYVAEYARWNLPLGTNRIPIRDFQTLCETNGIHFSWAVPDF